MAKPSGFTAEMFEKYTREGYWKRETISDYWERNAGSYPDREAIVDSGVRLTWSEAKTSESRPEFISGGDYFISEGKANSALQIAGKAIDF